MEKTIIVLLCVIGLSSTAFGQNTSITNNNTITIQGNVYYFQPSTTPSSPPPTQTTGFLGSGSWYGEHAARAWASIADWVIDRHVKSTSAVIGKNNERVYISAVHVIRDSDSDFARLKYPYGGYAGLSDSRRQVRIDYWVVRSGSPMADGNRETRWFCF
jgi:hypothetical protein